MVSRVDAVLDRRFTLAQAAAGKGRPRRPGQRQRHRRPGQQLRVAAADNLLLGTQPGGLQPVPHQLHVLPLYRWFSWLVPVARLLNYASTLRELGLAMLHAAERGAPGPVLEVTDINQLAKR